jgi:hypothetical protein
VAGKPTVIFVAGYDYAGVQRRDIRIHKHRDPGFDPSNRFRDMCEARTRTLFNQEHNFLLFDFVSGKVMTDAGRNGKYKTEEDNHGARPIKFPQDYFTFDNPENYPHFKATDHQVMSITDVYDRIIRLDSKQLIRFEIFSHGQLIGPILFNAFEGKDYLWAEDKNPTDRHAYENRDPLDTDGRSLKDFNENMGLEAVMINKNGRPMSRLEAFKDSFSPQAEVRIWGCARGGEEYRDLLNTTASICQDAHQFKKKLDMTVTHEFQVQIEHSEGPSTFEIKTYTLQQVVEILKARIGLSYGGQLCLVTGATCHVAFPGTYSTYSRQGASLMWVPVGDVEEMGDPGDHARRLQVYKQLIPGSQSNKQNYGILTASFLKSSGIEKAALDMIKTQKAILK